MHHRTDSGPEAHPNLPTSRRNKLLATLLGCRFDDLRQREQERRTRRAIQIGALLAAVLAVVAGLAGVSALLYVREQAAHQLALGRQLVAQSEVTAAQRPEFHEASVLLAAEGLRRPDAKGIASVASDQAFRAAMDLLPRPVSAIALESPARASAVNRTGSAFAIPREDGLVQVYRSHRAAPLTELRLEGDLQTLVFNRSGDLLGVGFDKDVRLGAGGRYLTAVDHRRVRRVWDEPEGRLLNEGPVRSDVALIGDGGLLATTGEDAVEV